MKYILAIFVFLSAIPGFAQDPDKLFEQARQAAFERKDYDEAKKLSLQALQHSPDYHDIRVFYGRLNSWENDYDKADEAFARVLSSNPSHLDARLARIDALIWDDEYEKAIEQANEGLKYNPGNRELLLKKGKALLEEREYDESASIVDALVAENRNDSAALKLLEDIYYTDLKFRLGAGYKIDIFDREGRPEYGPFHMGSVEAGNRFEWGSLIFRTNFAHRNFSSTASYNDIQFEADAWPRITRGLYFYLNGGFSPDRAIDESNLFPKFRAGAEGFKSLPKSFEASLGFRYLDFYYDASGSNVWIYTASLSKYIGNYWISLRSFFRPENGDVSHTELLYVRKYWGANVSRFGLPFFGQNFVGVYAGRGTSPREPQFIQGDLNRLNSWKAGIEFQKILNKVWILGLNAGYENEQWNMFDATDRGNRFSFGVELNKLFFKSRYKPEKRYE